MLFWPDFLRPLHPLRTRSTGSFRSRLHWLHSVFISNLISNPETQIPKPVCRCEHQSGISCNNQVRLQGILLFLVRVSDHLQQFFCIIYAKMHEKLTFFPSKNIFCPLLWESSFQKVPYSSRNLLYKKSVSSKKSLIVRESLIHRLPYCERRLYYVKL